MGLLSNIAAAASAGPTVVRLQNQIILESKYQKVANPEAQVFFSPEPGKLQVIPDSMRELVDIGEAYKRAQRSQPLDKNTFKYLRTRLDTWSRQYGTKTRSASSIMREYSEFANDELLKDRKKDEEKAKKEADKSAKRDLDAKKKTSTGGKARGGTSTGGAGNGSHRR